MKKTYLHIILLLLISTIIFPYCTDLEDEECYDADYSSCDTWEPFWGELDISLTINEENPEVPITIYRGKLEDEDIVKQCTIRTPTLYYEVPLDIYYTVKAEYKSGDKTIYAVDGDEIKKHSTDYCDSTCWEIRDGYYNVELKY